MSITSTDKMADRKIVTATFHTCSSFVIPEGIDLEGVEVKSWHVRYDELLIFMKDGREIHVRAYVSASESDLKHPEEENIEDADNIGVDDDYKDEDYVTILD